MDLKETILALCRAEGVTGRNCAAAQQVLQRLQAYTSNAEMDVLGSVTGTVGSGTKTILLDAHLDQIALVVTSIEERGFVRVAKVGGVDRRTLIGKPVIIYGKETVHAIVSSIPPHLMNSDNSKLPELEQMLVDTGLSTEQTNEWIAPGDMVLMDVMPQSLLGTRVTGPALDNRCGVAAVLRCLELLKDEDLPVCVAVQFSVQEEFRHGGAITSAFRTAADEAIAVDVSFAQAPGTPPEIRARLGEGTMIGISPVLHRAVSETLLRLAKEQHIPYQIEAMGGKTGTNVDDIAVSRGGVATGLLSIPQKNMHTGVEIVDVNDVESTAQLLAAYIRNGGADCGRF